MKQQKFQHSTHLKTSLEKFISSLVQKKTKDFEKYTDDKKWEKPTKKNIIIIYKALGYAGVNSNYLCNSLGAKDNNLKQ